VTKARGEARLSKGLAQHRGTRHQPPHCWQATRQGGKPAEGQPSASCWVYEGLSWETRLVGATPLFSCSTASGKAKASGISTFHSDLPASLRTGCGSSRNAKQPSDRRGQASRRSPDSVLHVRCHPLPQDSRCTDFYKTQLLPNSRYCFQQT